MRNLLETQDSSSKKIFQHKEEQKM
uniref:Uncharacterized protein n=1 Tax=Rhizophora mucronata TaxID=61149 RepID=A0A2P2JJ31_RHIMU